MDRCAGEFSGAASERKNPMADPLKALPDQWIAQGDDVASGRLLDRVNADLEIKLVRQVAKDIVVLAMTSERADSLKREFGARLIIEPDASLKLSTGPIGL
jgi:hypothetical protein